MAETFSIVLPEISSKTGNASGTIRASSLTAVGATAVPVDGISGVLKTGDMVKFANHAKVYMITADRSGNGSLSIEPALQAAVANNEALTYDNVPFLARLNNDIQEYALASASLVDYDVDFIEAV